MRFKFIQIKGFAFFQGGGGDKNEILKKYPSPDFNQTWLKAALGEDDSRLFK